MNLNFSWILRNLYKFKKNSWIWKKIVNIKVLVILEIIHKISTYSWILINLREFRNLFPNSKIDHDFKKYSQIFKREKVKWKTGKK